MCFLSPCHCFHCCCHHPSAPAKELVDLFAENITPMSWVVTPHRLAISPYEWAIFTSRDPILRRTEPPRVSTCNIVLRILPSCFCCWSVFVLNSIVLPHLALVSCLCICICTCICICACMNSTIPPRVALVNCELQPDHLPLLELLPVGSTLSSPDVKCLSYHPAVKTCVILFFAICQSSPNIFNDLYRKFSEGAVAQSSRLKGNRLNSEVVEHVEHRCEPLYLNIKKARKYKEGILNTELWSGPACGTTLWTTVSNFRGV